MEIEELKLKLEKLKSFRKKLNSDNTSELDSLMEEIKKDLPDEYKARLNVLNIYEFYDEEDLDNDLPF